MLDASNARELAVTERVGADELAAHDHEAVHGSLAISLDPVRPGERLGGVRRVVLVDVSLDVLIRERNSLALPPVEAVELEVVHVQEVESARRNLLVLVDSEAVPDHALCRVARTSVHVLEVGVRVELEGLEELLEVRPRGVVRDGERRRDAAISDGVRELADLEERDGAARGGYRRVEARIRRARESSERGGGRAVVYDVTEAVWSLAAEARAVALEEVTDVVSAVLGARLHHGPHQVEALHRRLVDGEVRASEGDVRSNESRIERHVHRHRLLRSRKLVEAVEGYRSDALLVLNQFVTTLSGGENSSDFSLCISTKVRLLHPFRVDSLSR